MLHHSAHLTLNMHDFIVSKRENSNLGVMMKMKKKRRKKKTLFIINGNLVS